MALVSGIDFYSGSWSITGGGGLAAFASAGAKLLIAKAGGAGYIDGKWAEHKAAMLEIGTAQKGAYWFLQRDFGDEPGYFMPPFTEGNTYITSSYGKGWTTPSHGHNNFAVDFNATDGSDEGDAVRSVANGTVAAANLGWDDDPGQFFTDASWQTTYGTRFIDHPGGYRTQYTHMKNILVSAGASVTRGQKIGEVSTKGSSGAGDPAYAHLHHAHFKRAASGQPYVPVKMKFLGDVAMTASRANTWTTTYSPNRWTGQNVTGRTIAARYTGASQARMFLSALNPQQDPSGWFLAVDVEPLDDSVYGVTPHWPELKAFIEEFHRLAPGYPLFLYTRKNTYESLIRGTGGAIIDAKAQGFAGLWTADWTQVGGPVEVANAETDLASVDFASSLHSYAGFTRSTIVQFGSPDYVNGGLWLRGTGKLDGNVFDGTLRQLRGIATGSGDPDPTPGTVPNVIGLAEATALTAIVAAGYIAGDQTDDYHVTLPAGVVISTDPPPAFELVAGSEVHYVVSLGPRPPTETLVPDVVGLPEADALDEFTAAGLIAGTRTEDTDRTVAIDNVISTDPVAGTTATTGDPVDYVVSLGPPTPTAGFDPTPPSPCG